MDEGDFFANIEKSSFETSLDTWVTEYYNAVQQLDRGNEA
jgi:hypothetical protein